MPLRRNLLIMAFAIMGLFTIGGGGRQILAQETETYSGFTGRWVTVVATAYSPVDAIDAGYHATKGKWRWITADGRTDVRETPYGIAVPRAHGSNRPYLPFGTKVIIPTESGYVARARAVNRLFTVDDVGAGRQYFRYDKAGRLHIDLRFKTHDSAIQWAGPTGRRVLRVFIVDGVALAKRD